MSEKDGIIKSCQGHSCGSFQDSKALTHFIPIVHGVSKGVEDGCKLPALPATNLETSVRPFQGWPLSGSRRVGHGGP
jgi:hypothetical protein